MVKTRARPLLAHFRPHRHYLCHTVKHTPRRSTPADTPLPLLSLSPPCLPPPYCTPATVIWRNICSFSTPPLLSLLAPSHTSPHKNTLSRRHIGSHNRIHTRTHIHIHSLCFRAPILPPPPLIKCIKAANDCASSPLPSPLPAAKLTPLHHTYNDIRTNKHTNVNISSPFIHSTPFLPPPPPNSAIKWVKRTRADDEGALGGQRRVRRGVEPAQQAAQRCRHIGC